MKAIQHVGILNYSAGNIKSLYNAFVQIDANVTIINEPSQMKVISHLVFPGVGAFGYCQQELIRSGMKELVQEIFETQSKPVLGICVGMQMLADGSEEFGSSKGLGICGGTVKKIPTREGYRVPHVGWNEVYFTDAFGTFSEGEQVDFYFDHSFALDHPNTGVALGKTEHSIKFTSLVRNGLVIGAQFHPEKSQTAGLAFLRAFLNIEK